MRTLLSLAVLLIVLLSSGMALAVVFVDGDRPGGDGSSWESAYNSLETAIAEGGTNQEFWIAGGTYTPSMTLSPKEGSSFYGGFAGNETRLKQRDIEAHPVIVDGQQSLIHVFSIGKLTPNILFDGLTIRGGRSAGRGMGGMGGAIFINRTSAQIRNCTFENNSAEFGGAIYRWDSDLIIENCLFENNHANLGVQQRGGAIWSNLKSPLIQNCTFVNNRAGRHGGAMELGNTPNAVISFSTFSGNSAERGGGAVALLWDQSSPEPLVSFEKCLFENNACGLVGGGIYSYYVTINVRQCDFTGNRALHGGGVMLDYKLAKASTIDQSRFVKNKAEGPGSAGGALHSYARSVHVKNSLFTYNTAQNAGALRFHSGSDDPNHYNANYAASVTNSTLYGNAASQWGGAIANVGVPMFYLTNSILWGNQAVQTYYEEGVGHLPSIDIANNGSSSMTIRNTNMESLDWEHGSEHPDILINSFSANPLFVDPDGPDNIKGNEDDNLHLQESSPCIDLADSNYIEDFDLACYPRVDHSGIPNTGVGSPDYADIGALERIEDPMTQPYPSCELTLPPPAPLGGNEVLSPILHLLLNSYGNGGTT